jgi:hypothetical protein
MIVKVTYYDTNVKTVLIDTKELPVLTEGSLFAFEICERYILDNGFCRETKAIPPHDILKVELLVEEPVI